MLKQEGAIRKISNCDYEIIREGSLEVMRINCVSCNYVPSIEDNALCMMRTIDKLVEVPSTGRIVFRQRKNYVYNQEQTQLLAEIANLYSFFTKERKILGLNDLIGVRNMNVKHTTLQYLILNLLRSDPIGCYVETIRSIRSAKIELKELRTGQEVEAQKRYISLLEDFATQLGKAGLIKQVKEKLAGHLVGDRILYKEIFRAEVMPDFMHTRLMARVPMDGDDIDVYNVGENEIRIFKIPQDIKYLYHITPPEFKLSEDEQVLLNLARTVLTEHKPKEEEFLDPARMRRTFANIGKDLLVELAESRKMDIEYKRIEELAKILVRYTVGFGILEVLLQDPKIQDVAVNGPIGQNPIFVVHQDYDNCITNIWPSQDDGEGWASKLRLVSGRPLDEANPVLDTELIVPDARARVSAMGRPLSPVGYSFAFRRHRDMPWTLPLYINNRMITPLAAGLVSFLIDGARTLLVAGTRSSGKTSFLGSCLVELMRKYRCIVLEDTRELPVDTLRKFGYDIQPMKVRSALMVGGTEVGADEGIRTSLRFGDSSLIVGEIRSLEAKALFEAMRVGALANVVAGTIHGADPYSVYDRIVNDLDVPKTSFKATDIILVCNPVKSPDGLHKWKRVMQISEVRKHWTKDPLIEKGFVDLMKYDAKTDSLEPTDELINGESEVLKAIAGNVKSWAGNWDAVWENIALRAKVKETLVNYAKEAEMPELLEAGFVINANDQFHKFSDEIMEEVGELDSKRIFLLWDSWLKREIKKRRILV